MSKSFYHKITDEQWKIIEPHLPKPKSTGRQGINPRTAFNAILGMLDSGAKWRYMPKEFGNWNSIYHIFRKWIDLGVFEKILQSLVEKSRKYFLVEIARFINTPPEHAKFWEIKISGCHAEEKTTKFMLSLIFNLSAFL